jgi:hypothetical protein
MEESIESGEKEITGIEVLNALKSISQNEWEDANWPVITAIPKGIYHQLEDSNNEKEVVQRFFKEIFSQENFITQEGISNYDPENDMLFVIHSFRNRRGQETIFKAITTSPESIVQDPAHLINYRYHGQPCEVRSRQIYPTIDFWNFYDRLPSNEQDNYPIPSKEWRKNFVLKRFFNR